MIPNNRAFNGKPTYEDNGKIISRWHRLGIKGDYQLHFRFISVNPERKQAVALFFSNYVGEVRWNGQLLTVPQNAFGHYLFKMEDFPDRQFTLCVCAREGELVFGNASLRPEVGTYTCGSFGNAFWIEKVDDTVFRFHCNDHEYNEDFNDLIFELEIQKTGDRVCTE